MHQNEAPEDLAQWFPAESDSLVAKCEDGIESEEHPVDDRQRGLDKREVPGSGSEGELPGLDDEHTAGHEQSAAQDTEEYVDALVYGSPHQNTCMY